MQALTGFYFEIVIVTLHLFRCCPQLKLLKFLPNYRLKDLSVALLITLISLFSFQGAIFCPLLSPEISSQFLKSLFPSLTRIGGPEWARTTDLTIISRTL